MNVAVIGTGYVGLVAGICFSHLGHNVICCDRDEIKIDRLRRGELPIYEPGLDLIFDQCLQSGLLAFETSVAKAVRNAKIVLVAIGTPQLETGQGVDLTQLNSVVREIIAVSHDEKVVVVKSTVPLGTSSRLEEMKTTLQPDSKIHFASNPEFLREGNAVADFLEPDRIVIDVSDELSRTALIELYSKFDKSHVKMIVTNPISAELIKYAANGYLATRLTFFNQISDICEAAGANSLDLAKAVGLDFRIGPHFMHPGPGYGGSCFPKDTNALAAVARDFGAPATVLEAAIAANEKRQADSILRVERAFGNPLKGAKVAVLGVAFKAGTDDIRDSASLKLIPDLVKKGAIVSAYDPHAMPNAKQILNDVKWGCSALEACHQSDVVVVMTEWDEFYEIEASVLKATMKGNTIVDFRNVFDSKEINAAGLNYYSLGSPPKLATA